MKYVLLFLMAVITPVFSQVVFNEYFENKTMRVDYQHAGNYTEDHFYFTEMIEEPFWGGPVRQLIEPFEYGKFRFEIQDSASGNIIYARNYSTLFSEWQTTEEAKHLMKSFPEGVVLPYPKNKFSLIFYSRDKQNTLHEKTRFTLDPKSYFVKKDRRLVFPKFEVQYSGPSDSKVDIVIIPEGYTVSEMDQFRKDCSKFTEYLFRSSPYTENREKFNIWGIEAPSRESGTDIPGKGVYVSTLANTSFYTFDIERYCMTTDYASVRDLAANAPYDQIYVLVNTNKYGGGAIYNFYSICVNDNLNEEYIFVHEFGHGFASLADEYFESSTAYQDFYPTGVEPTDPNITTLVNFEKKWKNLIDEKTPIPTPATSEYKKTVGVFEGGGYVAKGVYRPMQDCQMKSITINNFCPVCKAAIVKMIQFYTE